MILTGVGIEVSGMAVKMEQDGIVTAGMPNGYKQSGRIDALKRTVLGTQPLNVKYEFTAHGKTMQTINYNLLG